MRRKLSKAGRAAGHESVAQSEGGREGGLSGSPLA